jgi:hypothetical protein
MSSSARWLVCKSSKLLPALETLVLPPSSKQKIREAAEQGYAFAQLKMAKTMPEMLNSEMAAEQIAEAQRLSRDWKPRPHQGK